MEGGASAKACDEAREKGMRVVEGTDDFFFLKLGTKGELLAALDKLEVGYMGQGYEVR